MLESQRKSLILSLLYSTRVFCGSFKVFRATLLYLSKRSEKTCIGCRPGSQSVWFMPWIMSMEIFTYILPSSLQFKMGFQITYITFFLKHKLEFFYMVCLYICPYAFFIYLLPFYFTCFANFFFVFV